MKSKIIKVRKSFDVKMFTKKGVEPTKALVLMGECIAKKLLITFEMFRWLLRLLLLGGAAEAALPSSEPVASITASSTSILTLLLFFSLTPSHTSGTKILQIKPLLLVFQFFTDFYSPEARFGALLIFQSPLKRVREKEYWINNNEYRKRSLGYQFWLNILPSIFPIILN